VLRRRAKRDGSSAAIIVREPDTTPTAVSYAELNDLTNRMAGVLDAAGTVSGDVVAMMAPNGIDHVVVYFAALKLGAAFTAFNPRLTPAETRHLFDSTRPRVTIASPRTGAQLGDLSPDIRGAILTSNTSNDSITVGSPLHELMTEVSAEEPRSSVEETDIAMIVYTSGTESKPKGVRIPHRNFLIATTPAWIGERYIEGDDRFLLVAPMYTMAGIGTVTNLIAAGACIVFPETLNVEDVLATIEQHQITNMSQTPTFYSKLVESEGFDESRIGSLRQCHTYGGSIPRAVVSAFADKAPGAIWATYWGQTELSQLGSIGFYRTLDEVPDEDVRWIGRPVPQLEIRVIDEAGNPAEVGELLCRSPALMEGYHNEPELTRQVIHDGWLHTGDIVRVDAESNLFFYDRKKDVIKSGGMNISSLEVENALVTHAHVGSVAVVGRPDAYWSEAVTAFVVPAAGHGDRVDAENLIAHARKNLAPYKVPKEIVFLDALPRDRQGKILKRKLRSLAARDVAEEH
jgi:acyl-CoA synthetase (AMP-forming)/AMP-acid ligase II